MSDRRVLILFAHPSLERSEINSHLTPIARETEGCTLVDLYGEYPDYRIDINREQRRLCEHDVIVFLFPLFWYSTPALLKEWQDLVLEYGFAYGSGGTALAGKYFLCACTAGGPETAYRSAGYNHYGLRELLRPLEQTASLCQMPYLPPFVLFGSRTAVEEGRRERHLQDFRDLLRALQVEHLAPWTDSDAGTLNELLPSAATAAEVETP